MKKGGYSFLITEPAFERILGKVNAPAGYFQYFMMFQKDSLDMTLDDRIELRDFIHESESNHFIITHGTDSILDTAQVLSSLEKKTIILTGSFLPERFKGSEASFNLGMAVGAVRSMRPGVYVAMNARVIPWKKCRRLENGMFVFENDL